MSFPGTSERVVYQQNPLVEVICQLRFPSILKIETGVLADFQDRIRSEFPYYKTKSGLRFPKVIPEEVAKIVSHEFGNVTGLTAHEFTSKDQTLILSLTPEFLALTSRDYRDWNEFKKSLIHPLSDFQELYNPNCFSRIGLRYRNIVSRSKLGLPDVSWQELLNPSIAGVLASEANKYIEHSASEILIKLSDGRSRIRVHHGLVQEGDKETRYLLDADLFDDKETETPDATQKLDYLNEEARRFFRWCIRDRLHEALLPIPGN